MNSRTTHARWWVGTTVLLTVPIFFGNPLAQTQPASDEGLRKAFAAADENKDGVIDVDEAVGDAIYIFAALDKNKDRHLTSDELPGYDTNRVKRADRDGDGRLSISEVVADRVWEFFEADGDRNGTLTFEEVRLYGVKVREARK
jgi:Ca2+-binding EF-hand superfamily protein